MYTFETVIANEIMINSKVKIMIQLMDTKMGSQM